MFEIFECVAEAAIEHGVSLLLEATPGGRAIYTIGSVAWKKYSERCRGEVQREELRRIAMAQFSDIVAAAKDASRKAPAASDREALEQYLASMQASIRRSFKRPDDPSGTTVPESFALDSAEQFVALIPQSFPRHRPGESLPGRTQWKLVRLLGIGGFGEVWLARHGSYESMTGAVKFCRQLESGERSLLHESKLIDRLLANGTHPNVIKLTDAHLEGDSPWLMYEHVGGGDLGDLIRRWAAVPAKDRIPMALAAWEQLAGAIGDFHSMSPPIVHRDLKPSNILVDPESKRLRITDFGIGAISADRSLRADSNASHTRTGQLLTYLHGSHTPLYASPEQRRGEPPDPRDDVHALGVIAYQMLTGQIDHGIGPDLQEELCEAGLDGRLIEVVRNCVTLKTQRRIPDGTALHERLAALNRSGNSTPNAAARNESATPQGAPVRSTPQIPSRRNIRRLAILLVAIAILAAASLAAIISLSNSIRTDRLTNPHGPEKKKDLELPKIGDIANSQSAGKLNAAASAIARGEDALARKDYFAARSAFHEALAQHSKNVEAKRGLDRTQAAEYIATLRPGEERAVVVGSGVTMIFCWIPPGTAKLGSPLSEVGRPVVHPVDRIDLEPVHDYKSDGFWLGKCEVTQQQWQALMGNNPSWFSDMGGGKVAVIGVDTKSLPVEQVNWHDCQGYLKTLNDRTVSNPLAVPGKAGRFVLPLEDEWEYAARGGGGEQWPFFWGPNFIDTAANCTGHLPIGTRQDRTTPVGFFAPPLEHRWGLQDMCGNVSEWCENLYFSWDTNITSEGGKPRSVRGGSFASLPEKCRHGSRDSHLSTRRSPNCGFRVCFRLEPKDDVKY